MTVVLRRSTPADVEDLVAVFLRCWRISYAEILAEGDLAHWDEPAALDLWNKQLESTRSGISVTVAEIEGRVLGLIRTEASAADGYVHSLYVDPDAAGHGLGRLLVEHAASDLALAGCTAMRLWVFSANHAAQAFYRRVGFTDDGRRAHEPPYLAELTGMTRMLCA